MPLPAPAPRRHMHTRSVSYQGYQRDDGLWDIEALLTDVKPYSFTGLDGSDIPADKPIHGMGIRLTIDESLVIQAIATTVDHAPYGECQQGNAPVQQLVGARLGPGWRQAIEQALGGVRGCTHLRELLFNMATAAYQALFPVLERRRREEAAATGQKPAPGHLNGCIAWDSRGPVTARLYPHFVNWQKRPKPPSPT
ncbi:MAG TPA: DUF2889 domain-containing protein [Ramlibacter sp.]|nr:DUF2889 domain-containing protein [Ramlibacter sp.]